MKLVAVLLLLVGVAFGAQEYVDGEYFLRLNNEVNENVFVHRIKTNYKLDVIKSYQIGDLRLLLVKGEENDVIRASKMSEVKYWDRNMIVHTQQCAEHSNPGTWGLDRLDQRIPMSYTNPTSPSSTYIYGEDDGAGVYAYIVDSGIDINHGDFGGRAIWGTAAGNLRPGTDENGHGTHCAGTVGSDSYGVAKESTLVAVKVLNALGSGSTSDIVEGMQWVLTNHNSRPNAKSVVNMSLGGKGTNSAMEDAVKNLINGGVTVCIAAGNSNEDACGYTPARVPEAITVGASDINDVSASFTNYGTCLDLFAPGVDILSTVPGDATDVYDGTSMATPHVAGVIARYLSSQSSVPSPSAVRDYIVNSATPDVLTFRLGHGASPNLLLYASCPM
ncbi:hypothetical protein LSH36_1114g00012 [Paralvinella palmiformis]|uniref:Peptidase S8/S53 domain-containing protein n=1 Tax=Paralvinella palmiformis TaxID=53620 RepID=A0AAD9MRF3_9ANNE|nr:hypothetical protein LSH36_1114g00011 [Paralvinella palmiformis]KAK2141354.1 hypothetical protein LSH36_1114g00012 [Paralvinella palmiformis]